MWHSRTGRMSLDRSDMSQFRADVHVRWKRGLDTATIARELNVQERDVERVLHQIADARNAVNTVLGAG